MNAKFEAERPRLVSLASRILGDPHEAEDIVHNAWLRMQAADNIDNVAGWLTTVTTRMCLDRLRARTPVLEVDLTQPAGGADAADDLALAETVGVALHILLDRLSPAERVAFVLHESFGFDFSTIADILGRTPTATRKLASRAREKIGSPKLEATDPPADWQVVDAFMAAAREGDFSRLLALLAPDVVVEGDHAAIGLGTPTRMDGATTVAEFFNGGASSAFPVHIGDRPGAAWMHRGEAKVAFDFTVAGGLVQRIDFRANPAVLAQVTPR